MITQCEIRKLYAKKDEPGVSEAIELAKSCERRRCGHHPDEYPEPLSTLECFQSVVDPKGSGENKHRYVVASQSQDLRRLLRGVRGVPLIYIKRSVMILEPMSDESSRLRAREERSKFRAGIKPTIGKRKRDEKEEESEDDSTLPNGAKIGARATATGSDGPKKTKKKPGPKGPNPLSVKKSKKKGSEDAPKKERNLEEQVEGPGKRKRRRKAKTAVEDGDAAVTSSTAAAVSANEDN